jgi:hypothetical protein
MIHRESVSKNQRQNLGCLLSENRNEWSLCLAHEGSNASGHMPAQGLRCDLLNHEGEHTGARGRPDDHKRSGRASLSIYWAE